MAPPSHTEETKRNAVQKLVDEYMSEERIKDVGLFDAGRLQNFLHEYREDPDQTSKTRKDALLNHLLGLHILHHHFISEPVAA